MKKTLGILVLWAACSFTNAGFVNAHFEQQFSGSCDFYRGDLASAVGLSMFPLTWILTPFLTGFYEHGWRLAPSEECQHTPPAGSEILNGLATPSAAALIWLKCPAPRPTSTGYRF
jgi:hypothetical protein